MDVRTNSSTAWLLLTFTLPTKRASQRVEVWRKLQRYGTVPLGNSGYLLPSNPTNEERFQWLAPSIGGSRCCRWNVREQWERHLPIFEWAFGGPGRAPRLWDFLGGGTLDCQTARFRRVVG